MDVVVSYSMLDLGDRLLGCDSGYVQVLFRIFYTMRDNIGFLKLWKQSSFPYNDFCIERSTTYPANFL